MSPAQREWEDALRSAVLLLAQARRERDAYRAKYERAMGDLKATRSHLSYYTSRRGRSQSLAERRLPQILAVMHAGECLTFNEISVRTSLSKDVVVRTVEIGVDTGKIIEVKKGGPRIPSLFALKINT